MNMRDKYNDDRASMIRKLNDRNRALLKEKALLIQRMSRSKEQRDAKLKKERDDALAKIERLERALDSKSMEQSDEINELKKIVYRVLFERISHTELLSGSTSRELNLLTS